MMEVWEAVLVEVWEVVLVEVWEVVSVEVWEVMLVEVSWVVVLWEVVSDIAHYIRLHIVLEGNHLHISSHRQMMVFAKH